MSLWDLLVNEFFYLLGAAFMVLIYAIGSYLYHALHRRKR